MTSYLYRTVFLVVLLGSIICWTSAASREDSIPHYDYIQIFKSIPALFEYLLDALEERPEILEKNDVTLFTKRNIDGTEKEEGKTVSKSKNNKREITVMGAQSDEVNENVDVDKRDADDPKTTVRSTVAYEYGNSNVKMKELQEEENKDVSKRFANAQDKDNNKNILTKQSKTNDQKEEIKLDKVDNLMLNGYGEEVFLGFEHLFGLDLKPEEIEEKILEAEKLLENHNKKEKGDK